MIFIATILIYTKDVCSRISDASVVGIHRIEDTLPIKLAHPSRRLLAISDFLT